MYNAHTLSDSHIHKHTSSITLIFFEYHPRPLLFLSFLHLLAIFTLPKAIMPVSTSEFLLSSFVFEGVLIRDQLARWK